MAARTPAPGDETLVTPDRKAVRQWSFYLRSLSALSGAEPIAHQPDLPGAATLADTINAFNALRSAMIAAGLMKAS